MLCTGVVALTHSDSAERLSVNATTRPAISPMVNADTIMFSRFKGELK